MTDNDGLQAQSGMRAPSVMDLLRRVTRGWRVVLFCCVVGFFIGASKLMGSPVVYTAAMTVGSPPESQTRSLSLASAALGSLGLAGMTGSVNPSGFQDYESLLTSRAVAKRLEQQHKIMTVVFAARWDPSRGAWVQPAGIKPRIRNLLYQILGWPPRPLKPSIEELSQYLTDNIVIESAGLTSPKRTLSMTSPDPVYAANMLRWVHDAANSVVRDNALLRNKEMIGYLERQLPLVQNGERHDALINLLLSREQDLMMLMVNSEYAAVTLDPPTIPEIPSGPKIGLTVFTWVFAGAAIGFLLVISDLANFILRFLATLTPGLRGRLGLPRREPHTPGR